MKADINTTIDLPEGISASLQGQTLTVKGEKGEVTRKFMQPKISMKVAGDKVELEAKGATQREKRHLNTIAAHIKNAVRGVAEGHNYKLKICSGHFPMNVSINNGELVVKNFLGEAVPRRLKLKEGINVKVSGDVIECSGVEKEKVGNQASDIEQLTRITNRDRRIFQDGIYITEKDGVVLQ